MLTINEVYTLKYIGNPQKYIQTGNVYTFKIKETEHGLILEIISETKDIEGIESESPVIINYSNINSIEKNWKKEEVK